MAWTVQYSPDVEEEARLAGYIEAERHDYEGGVASLIDESVVRERIASAARHYDHARIGIAGNRSDWYVEQAQYELCSWHGYLDYIRAAQRSFL